MAIEYLDMDLSQLPKHERTLVRMIFTNTSKTPSHRYFYFMKEENKDFLVRLLAQLKRLLGDSNQFLAHDGQWMTLNSFLKDLPIYDDEMTYWIERHYQRNFPALHPSVKDGPMKGMNFVLCKFNDQLSAHHACIRSQIDGKKDEKFVFLVI